MQRPELNFSGRYVRSAALMACVCLWPINADAHSTGASAHNSTKVGGTAPAVRLPSIRPLPLAKERSAGPVLKIGPGVSGKSLVRAKRAALIATPAAAGSTTLTAEGNAGTQITQNGTTFTITGGTSLNNGTDLIQSFGIFNLRNGDTADFLAGSKVKTIVARVTGGPATVDGILVASGNANLVLIDRAGVAFTANAQLNLGGSFAVTTADAMRLNDGLQINAATTSPLTVQTNQPAAFIFNSTSAGSLTFTSPGLSVGTGQTVTAVGGGISMDFTETDTPAGRVNLIATASAGTVQLDPFDVMSNVDVSSFGALGAISITDGSFIFADGNNGGRVCVRGDSLTLANSEITAQTTGNGVGLGVDITLTGALSGTNSSVISDTTSTGQGGMIQLTAASVSLDGTDSNGESVAARAIPSVTTDKGAAGGINMTVTGSVALTNGAYLSANTAGDGPGGDINLVCSSLMIRANTAGIFATTAGHGTGGNITVHASQDVTIDDANGGGGTSIATQTSLTDPGGGRAGDVTLTAGNLSVLNGGEINAATYGTGVGGNVNVSVAGNATLDGGTSGSTGGIFTQSILTTAGAGKGGDLTLTAGSLNVMNGANVDASTFGAADGGSVTVNVAGNVKLDAGPSGVFTAISAETDLTSADAGKGGEVLVTAGNLSIVNGATVDANTNGPGHGGSVTVNVAGDITLDAGGGNVFNGIAARTYSTDLTGGQGGDVNVTANTLSVLDGSLISAGSFGGGNAGSVSVKVAGLLTLNPTTSTYFTGIGDQCNLTTPGGGNGGNITIAAGNLMVENGAQIAVGTLGTGNAGSVTINVLGQTTLDTLGSSSFTGIDDSSQLTTPGGGNGDRITLTTGNLSVLNGAQISADTFGTGAGGDVTVHVAGTALLDGGTSYSHSAIDCESQLVAPGAGNSGIVTVTAGVLTVLHGASVDADTFDSGNAGDVNIIAGRCTVASGGYITSVTSGSGNASDINVKVTGDLTVNDFDGDGSTGIYSDSGSTDGGASGAGGKVTISAGTMEVLRGSGITCDAYGTGIAGDVVINVAGKLTVSGGSDQTETDVSAQSFQKAPGGGNGGDVTIAAGRISFLNGATLAAQTFGSSDAGSIRISGSKSFQIINSTITTNTAGAGGSIHLSTRSNMNLGSDIISAAAASDGNISFTTPAVVVAGNDTITARAQGQGGQIVFDPTAVVLKNTQINGTSFLGGKHDVLVRVLGGPVVADTRSQIASARQQLTLDLGIANVVAALNGGLLSDDVHLADHCGVNFANDNVSSFLIVGRGGTPVSPGGWLPDFDFAEGGRTTERSR